MPGRRKGSARRGAARGAQNGPPGRRRGGGPGTVAGADGIQGALQLFQAAALLLLGSGQKVELHAGLLLRDELNGGDGQGADGGGHAPAVLRQGHGGLGKLPGQVGGRVHRALAAEIVKGGVPDGQGHPLALHPAAPQPGGHLVGQTDDPGPQGLPPHQIVGEGVAVAHRLRGLVLPGGGDRGVVLAVGEVVELDPVFAQQGEQSVPVEGRQIADGADAEPSEGPVGRPAHIQ